MAKRRSALALSDQLNEAVEAVMAKAPLPPVDPQLAPLLQIAADLRDLPSADFKARLKADLQRRGPATPQAKPIPEGYHTATPCLVLRDAGAAIDFYKRAFGATELMRFAEPSGQIMHAEIQVGDSRIAMRESPTWISASRSHRKRRSGAISARRRSVGRRFLFNCMSKMSTRSPSAPSPPARRC